MSVKALIFELMANYYSFKLQNKNKLSYKLKLRALLVTSISLASLSIVISGISNMSMNNEQLNTIPTYKIDFEGNPSGVFNTPAMVRGNTQNGDRCLHLEVLLDENAEGLIFEKQGHRKSENELYYTVNNGFSARLGEPICLNGTRKALISFCADGMETAYYRVISVPRMKLTYDSLMLGGSGNRRIKVDGLEKGSINWRVISDQYGLIQNTDNLSEILIRDGVLTGNQKIQIEVSGTHISTCGGSFSCRQIINIQYYDSLHLETTPNKSVCAPGGSVHIDARGRGGKEPYQYIWKNRNGQILSKDSSYRAEEPGSYTVELRDATYQCSVIKTVEVNPAEILLPSVIGHQDITQNSVTIQWNQISSAAYYLIRYRDSNSKSKWNYLKSNDSNNSITIKKLKPGEVFEYQLMVTGDHNTDSSGWSKTKRFSTLSECIPALQLKSTMKSKKLLCKWNCNPYNSKQILLLRKSGGVNWERRFTLGKNIYSVYLDYLKPGETYDWMILSYCSDGEVPSEIEQFTFGK